MVALRLSVIALTLLLGIPAIAHPGHDALSHGMEHLLTSPYHLMILAGIGCGLVVSALCVHSWRGRLTLRITGAGMIAGTALVWVLR